MVGAGQYKNCTYGLGFSEGSGYVDSNTIGQRYHRADPGHRHQAPAHVIVPDHCKHASVQDADLFAYRPPDNEQRLPQTAQVRQILDDLLYSRLELHRSHYAPLQTEPAQGTTSV